MKARKIEQGFQKAEQAHHQQGLDRFARHFTASDSSIPMQ
jgi:hypothetical protein